MKIDLYFIFFSYTISLCIYLCKSQEIIKPTNYTLSYLENLDTSKITCQSNSDCPEYSKCEKITENNNTKSVCKFGSFLCPKAIGDYVKPSETNKYCVFINTEIWDIDKEELYKDANGKAPIIKPIIKICPNDIGRKDRTLCETEKCNKDEDCFSGTCHGNNCIYSDKVYHTFYRCTGLNSNIKCNKQNGMPCGSDEDCYSGICFNGDYCLNEKPSIGKAILKILIISLLVTLGLTLLSCLAIGIFLLLLFIGVKIYN